MSLENECEKKCFTFTWKLENVSFSRLKGSERMLSPVFKIDELEEKYWGLRLHRVFGNNNENIGFWLKSNTGKEGAEYEQLDVELAFLASDGTVLQSYRANAQTISKNGYIGDGNFVSLNEVFFRKKSVFLPQDTLTVRCRIWKSVGEFSKEVRCFARSRLVVEKRSLLWKIENFSTLESNVKRTIKIESQDTPENLIGLELVTKKKIFYETIRITIRPNYQIIKVGSFQLFVVDVSNNVVESFQDELSCHDSNKWKEIDLFLTKEKLIEKKARYLPNDTLSIKCEFSICSGIVQQEITKIITDCVADENNGLDDQVLLKEKSITDPKCILVNNLKSMINNSCLSDVKLKTKSQTYAAHTVILGARSAVFKAMFSSDMKEKVNVCVDIDDFNDDTVLRLLRYIYSAEVEELEWGSATQLYEAADKYEVLDLKDICSFYLRNNLCPSNACEALILADLHQDEGFKVFVQYFILKHRKDVICSEEWRQLETNNLKLAYETVRLKY